MSDHTHGHVPYLLLILYYLKEWKTAHTGKSPSVYKEKAEFRKLVSKGMRVNNVSGAEENFEEAVAAVLKNLNDPIPSSAVKEIFAAPECQNLKSDVSSL